MMPPIDWGDDVVEDYRQRILVDADSPILAFKASRDRYTNLPNQRQYAGLPYLGSRQSEDALTWNVFRGLHRAGYLDIVTAKLKLGEPRALLLWGLSPETDEASSELQYVTGSIIRRFDGQLRGQITEPDVIMLTTSAVAVIECKLSKPDTPMSRLWEGDIKSISKRRPVYGERLEEFIKDGITTMPLRLYIN